MNELLVVLTTVPDAETGARIARALVEERLAACINVVPGLRSIYRWEGKVADDAEVLLIAKIRRAAFDAYAARMKALHPYQVPEIVALEPARIADAYAAWCLESTE